MHCVTSSVLGFGFEDRLLKIVIASQTMQDCRQHVLVDKFTINVAESYSRFFVT